MIIVKRNVFEHINPEKELNDLVDFLKISWNFPANFSDVDLYNFVSLNYNKGLEIAADFRASEIVTHAVYDLLETHEDFLNENFKGLFMYDGFRFVIHSVMRGISVKTNEKHCNTDYTELRNQQMSATLSQFGDIIISPKYIEGDKNYEEVLEIYESNNESSNGLSFEDESYYEDDFKGHSVTPNGTVDFVARTSLSWVLCSHSRQGREPLEELINAIFSHGIQVAEHNNNVNTIETIKKIELPNTFQKDILIVDLIANDKFLSLCHKSSGVDFLPISDDKYNDFLNKTGTFHPDYVAPKRNMSKLMKEKLARMVK